MHPDWLGSPQHVVGGVVLTIVAMVALRRSTGSLWLLALTAVGVTALAEIAIELVEYPLLYAGHLNRSAYYDTLADIADTVAGSVAGALVFIVAARRRRA